MKAVGREDMKGKPVVFLGWEPNLGSFANTAPLKSGYPLFNSLPGDCACFIIKLYVSFSWGLSSTCAAGSTMTQASPSPAHSRHSVLLRRGSAIHFADGELAPGDQMATEVTGNQTKSPKSQVRPLTPGISFLSLGADLWVRVIWISPSSYLRKGP